MMLLFKSRFRFIFLATALCFLSLSTHAAEDLASLQAEYKQLKAEAYKNPAAMNARRIRQLFPISGKKEDYKPYDLNPVMDFEIFTEKFQEKNPSAQKALDIYVDRFFAMPQTHTHAAELYAKIGNKDAARLHYQIGKQLILALMRSGNGLSPETAYHVLAVPEEYMLARFFLVRVEKQRTVPHNKNMYDVLEGQSRVKGPGSVRVNNKRDIWFNISPIWSTLP